MPIMFSLFRKKPVPIPLEQQLKTLAECGIALSPDATLDDLFMFSTREELEAAPYKELIPTLGCEMERDSFAPLCHRLWMCDYERVEGHGAYAEVINRLHQMSEQNLAISRVSDYVDIEAETAWVEFDLAGSRIHWDVKVDNDWLDPYVVVNFDHLLETHGSALRIYSNHTEFGQSAFFACLTPTEFEKFQKLATFELQKIEEQR